MSILSGAYAWPHQGELATCLKIVSCRRRPRPRFYSNLALVTPVRASSSFSLALIATVSNPETVEEVSQQAANAVDRAVQEGKSRQLLNFLLPVDQRQFNYLDTEPRDYPCSIRDEFMACCKVTTSILKRLNNRDGNEEILVKRIGELENEMDPVAALYPLDKSIAAIVFPIAETLKQIKSILQSEVKRPTLIVNPQWRSSGQIVSDFGFGPWKRQAEEFLNSFEPTYVLLEQRIGEASNVVAGSSGGVVRLLKCFPEDWHVYLMAGDGTSDLIGRQAQQPTYQELERLVEEARKTIPWKGSPRMLGGSEPPPPPLPKSLAKPLTEYEIKQMDKAELRRALMALKLPTSGRLEILQERLKEAQVKAES
ncbi:hypothetical protein GOP47_0011167 [Adiantum capillus-veneris]|uniref:DUF1995 domain-containing protein n=1 Tax=Adiantum capillus-veneris TaxID=13818 RepID=A0A9D4USP3_ADICA|nr:hypothetical protein GOP47_0011167 [Adiantum capillus-veneris]